MASGWGGGGPLGGGGVGVTAPPAAGWGGGKKKNFGAPGGHDTVKQTVGRPSHMTHERAVAR